MLAEIFMLRVEMATREAARGETRAGIPAADAKYSLRTGAERKASETDGFTA